MFTRQTPLIAFAGVAALALAACGGGDDSADTTVAATTAAPTTVASTTVAPTTTRATTTTVESTTTTTLPAEPRKPLTGEPLDSFDDIDPRPALVVKYDNISAAWRNQSGLALADIVFEEKVEGSITRFAAVFHSQDADPVGPIRSGRSQDVALLEALNQPLFAWSGGNPGVTRMVNGSTLVNIGPNHAGDAYYRGPGSRPHNLYSSTERLWAHTPEDSPGAPPQQFYYLGDDEEFTGDEIVGADITIGGYDIEWDWDAETGTFLRTQEGREHNDVVNGRIGATNVVMLVVEYKPSQVDASSPEAQTFGSGLAYVISDGKAIEAQWVRLAPEQPFRLQDTEGNDIELNPGNTWVELMEQLDEGPKIAFRY